MSRNSSRSRTAVSRLQVACAAGAGNLKDPCARQSKCILGVDYIVGYDKTIG